MRHNRPNSAPSATRQVDLVRRIELAPSILMEETHVDFACCMLQKWLIPSFVVLLVAAGCESQQPRTFPVRGKVTYQDGTPVTAGMVEFEPAPQEGAPLAERYNARGRIHDDGSYSLTTFREGDGAVAGRHRVIVQEPYPDADLEAGPRRWKPSIDPSYRRYEESGLEFDVKTEENEITIVVTRPA